MRRLFPLEGPYAGAVAAVVVVRLAMCFLAYSSVVVADKAY
jgi:hypothetical protein